MIPIITLSYVFRLLIIIFMFTDLHSKQENEPVETKKGFAVVELFTSEGCSSCPSADAVMIALSKEFDEDVYFLGYHVDYWNYLGWKDEYSSKAFTERQRLYGEHFNLGSIYTPQVIVNGKSQFVGSDKNKLKQTINDERRMNSNTTLELAAVSDSTGNIKITYKAATGNDEQLLIALIQRMVVTNVKRGENRGLELKHINIVRELKTAGPANAAILFNKPQNISIKEFSIISFIQHKKSFTITGAAKTSITE
jgi:hypothetical protein